MSTTRSPLAPKSLKKDPMQTPARAAAARTPGRLAVAALLAGAVALMPAAGRAADFDPDVLPLDKTHPVAFGVMGAFATCSVVSTVGNAVTYAQKKPHRGWMTSGFVCGFLNFISGPIILAYGRDASPAFGWGTGVAHVALGATNLGLAIANARLWHKQQTAADGTTPPPPVALAPLYLKTPQSGEVYGLSVAGGF